MPKTYTVKEVADLLGFSTNSIYTFIKEKRIDAIKIGSGRFRISELEIKKLLHLKETDNIPFAVPTSKPLINELIPEIEKSVLENLTIPSFSDWFVGISAIIIGFSFVLFTPIVENPFYTKLMDIAKTPIQITLMLGGAGMLLTDLIGKRNGIWHKVFHGILSIIFFVLAYSFLKLHDFAGSGLMILFGVFLILQLFIKINSVLRFGIFMFVVVLTQPILIVLSYVPISTFFLQDIFTHATTFIPFWTILILFSGTTVVLGRKKTPVFTWVNFLMYACITICISLWYAQNLAWTKSLLFLLIATFSGFGNWWLNLNFKHPISRIKGLVALSTVGFIFVATIIVIYAIQQNTISLTNQQLQDKATYSSLLVDNTILNVEILVNETAHNAFIVSELEKENQDEINSQELESILKTVVEGNPALRSLGIIDKKGYRIAGYPHIPGVDGANYKERDYFKASLNGKKMYISEVFTNIIDRPTLAISAPVLNEENEAVGVVAGALSFDYLNRSLQEASTLKFDEHITVIDKNNKYIIHPDPVQIGKPVLNYEISHDTQVSLNATGKHILVAVSKNKKRDWKTAVKTPLTTLLSPKSGETVLFYALITFFAGIFLLFISSSIRKKNLKEKESS